jgi:hypothetical protein
VKSRLHEARRRLAADPALSALAFMSEGAVPAPDTDTDEAAGADAVAGEEARS